MAAGIITRVIGLAVLFAVAFIFSGEAFAALRGSYVKGEALVLLKHDRTTQSEAGLGDVNGVVRAYAENVAGRSGAVAVATYNALSASKDGVFAFVRAKDGGSTDDLLAKLRSDPNVISAERNYFVFSSATPNDILYSELWGLGKINAPDAWDVTKGSDSYFVAVIDTGIRADHADLAANFSAVHSKNFTTGMLDGQPVVPDDNYQDDQGHGTHVSGTVGAVGNNSTGVVGVNWKTKVIAVKALDLNPSTGQGVGTSATIVAGIDHVVDLINNKNVNVAAVNMSFGGWRLGSPQLFASGNDAYYRAFKRLSEITVVVVAAGNDGVAVGKPDILGRYVYPASFIETPNKIVAGATSVSGKAADFTNWSDTAVDILAPGVGITSTGNGGLYASMSGTSMAAPHVAGAVALLKSANPDWGPAKLKSIILDTANGSVNPTTGPDHKPDDGTKVSAKGLLDVGKAVGTVLTLSDLKAGGASVPGFDPYKLEYTKDVGTASNVIIVPTPAYPNLVGVTLTMNGSNVTSPVSLQPGANTVEVKVKHNASGAVRTYMLEINTTATSGPQISRLVADPETVPSGGVSSITVYGVDMPDNRTLLGIFADPNATAVVSDNFTVPAVGTTSLRSANLTFPINSAQTDYYVKASVNSGTSWEPAYVKVTVYGAPTVTAIAAANRSLPWSGDNVGVVVRGSNLGGGVTVGAFTGGAAIPTATGTTYGNGTDQATSLAIPTNGTGSAKSYILKVSLDGGTTWQANPTDSLTVAAMPLITSVTASPASLPLSGGTSVVTVRGTNLLNAALLTVDIFSGGQYTDEYEELTVKSDTEATATLTFPAHSGSSGKTYELKIWRLEDEEYYDTVGSVVVGQSADPNPNPNPNPNPEPPGGGCGVGAGGAALAILSLFGIAAMRRGGR